MTRQVKKYLEDKEYHIISVSSNVPKDIRKKIGDRLQGKKARFVSVLEGLEERKLLILMKRKKFCLGMYDFEIIENIALPNHLEDIV